MVKLDEHLWIWASRGDKKKFNQKVLFLRIDQIFIDEFPFKGLSQYGCDNTDKWEDLQMQAE